MCFFIFLLLLFLNPKVTIYLSISYIIFYFVFFIFIKKKISKNNSIIYEQQKKKFQIINESIAGIKDIILANKKFSFYQKFFEANKIYHKKIARLISISLLPRGILELISIIIVTFVFITLLKSYNNDLSAVIPIISVYALAGLKMIPAIQVIFQNLSLVRGSMVEFNSIKNDLINSKTDFLQEGPNSELIFNNNLILDNISYNYLSRDLLVVNNLSLEIKKNTLVSIIGPNGSGKSTIIHIILGLLSPINGKILVDNKEINTEQMLIAWQKKIGYVSQNIFLFNDTILNNIVFDIDSKNVKLEEVYKIIDFINLKEFIDSLPYGLNTKVGDNGIFLSGGQKQKIAIARCLIKNSEVIIFDEATSSLDPESEKSINDLIFKLRNSKTIINVTHRIDSLVKSDLIYYIKEGQLVAKGNYEEVFSKIKSIRKSQII
jgi:HlyD family secretion protein